jgi:hypothetical protein
MYFEKNKKKFENDEDTIFGSILDGNVKANLRKLFIKKDKFFWAKKL